jgi:hypothetical protein
LFEQNLSDCDLVNGSVGIVTHYATGAQAIQDEGVLVAEIEDAAQPKRSAPTFDMIALHGKAKARAKSHLDVDPDLVPPGEWPVVEFRSAISGHTSKFLIPPCEFEVSDAEGKVECTRFGIPLLLAWALTVHKVRISTCWSWPQSEPRGQSQGQTIERLKIDLSTVFEVGQAYVAISRGVSLDTLEVKGFTNVSLHPAAPRSLTPPSPPSRCIRMCSSGPRNYCSSSQIPCTRYHQVLRRSSCLSVSLHARRSMPLFAAHSQSRASIFLMVAKSGHSSTSIRTASDASWNDSAILEDLATSAQTSSIETARRARTTAEEPEGDGGQAT